MELAIDTATDNASLALAHRGQVMAELTWHTEQNHSVEMLPGLIRLLQQTGVELSNIAGIAVAKGPGSYNGLRVGVSFAKGLAFSMDMPLVGVSTLEVEAFQHATTSLPICPILNAGGGEVATALFQMQDGRWHQLREEHIASVEELSTEIATKTLFCGIIAQQVADLIQRCLGQRAVLMSSKAAVRRAGYLAELGWERLARGECSDPATFQPMYLRRPSITKRLKKY